MMEGKQRDDWRHTALMCFDIRNFQAMWSKKARRPKYSDLYPFPEEGAASSLKGTPLRSIKQLKVFTRDRPQGRANRYQLPRNARGGR